MLQLLSEKAGKFLYEFIDREINGQTTAKIEKNNEIKNYFFQTHFFF